MNETLQVNKLSSFSQQLSVTTLPVSTESLANAKQFLEENDFPTTRHEHWKYTRLTKISGLQPHFAKAEVDNIQAYSIAKDPTRLVFVNGYYSKENSSSNLPQGLSIKPLSVCSPEEISSPDVSPKGVFPALNTTFLQDGFLLEISPKTVLEQTIEITHIITGDSILSNPRIIIKAGKFSKAEIIFGFFSKNAQKTLTNWSSFVQLEENAHLTINKIQYESEDAYQVCEEFIQQDKSSNFTINTITLNGGLVRNNLRINVLGENCQTHLNGAYLLKGSQHVDNHTVVDHKVAHCESNELYKGVIDEKATAVFNGKVYVRKDAQKINAFQSNANVLLSDSANVNSKPELEIYADDVKCSHGSTTGQLDEEAIFYLRARGISEKSARQLMVSAFIEDVLSKIENEDVLEFIHQILQERFGWEK